MEKNTIRPRRRLLTIRKHTNRKARSASLAGRLADARNEADTLQFQLDRIKNNPMWKPSKPLRQTMHWDCAIIAYSVIWDNSQGNCQKASAEEKRAGG